MTTNAPQSEKRGGILPRFLLPLAVILAVVLVALSLLRSHFESVPRSKGDVAKVGEPAPDFFIKRLLDEKQIRFSEILTGEKKVVMVNFWATWCEACMIEMPSIVRLYEAYKNRGFDVVAINLDENPKQEVPEVAKKLGMPFPIYVDNEDQDAAAVFDVHAIPLTAIIGKDRKVLLMEPGEREWDGSEVKAQLEKWLSE